MEITFEFIHLYKDLCVEVLEKVFNDTRWKNFLNLIMIQGVSKRTEYEEKTIVKRGNFSLLSNNDEMQTFIKTHMQKTKWPEEMCNLKFI